MVKSPETRPLDRIDRQILEILQRQGRISNTDLARRVNLTATPCQERVRRLEREGLIEGFGAQVNAERLGLPLLIFIQVRLEQTGFKVFEDFAQTVRDLPEVMECHMVAGGFDFLLKVRVRDMGAYRHFMGDRLSLLPGVVQTHSHVVMEEIKSTWALPVEEA